MASGESDKKEGLIPQTTEVLGKLFGRTINDLSDLSTSLAESEVLDETIESAIGTENQDALRDFTFGTKGDSKTGEGGTKGALNVGEEFFISSLAKTNEAIAQLATTLQGAQQQPAAAQQVAATNTSTTGEDAKGSKTQEQLRQNAEDATNPQSSGTNTGKIGTFLSRMTDKFLPGLKDTANMTLSLYVAQWKLLGDGFGSDNIQIISPDVDKNGNELEGPSLFDTIMMLASYDGEGKLPMPRGIVNMVKGIMSFFLPKGSPEVTDADAANMLVGFTRWALNALGMDDLITPGNPDGRTSPGLTSTQLNSVIKTLSNPSTLLSTLKDLSSVDMDLAKDFPHFITVAKATLQNSGVPIPDELNGAQVSTRDFIVGYAKSGNAMAAKKGWDNTPSDELLKASEEILQQAGASDPELARGLAVMAENGTSVVNILKSIFTSDASPAPAQENISTPDF